MTREDCELLGRMMFQREQQKQREKDLERVRKNTEKLEKAIRDIEYYNTYCNSLYQLLDIEKLEQAGAVPGSKTDIKCQKKIITLTNQIHTAEERIAKAKAERAALAV